MRALGFVPRNMHLFRLQVGVLRRSMRVVEPFFNTHFVPASKRPSCFLSIYGVVLSTLTPRTPRVDLTFPVTRDHEVAFDYYFIYCKNTQVVERGHHSPAGRLVSRGRLLRGGQQSEGRRPWRGQRGGSADNRGGTFGGVSARRGRSRRGADRQGVSSEVHTPMTTTNTC